MNKHELCGALESNLAAAPTLAAVRFTDILVFIRGLTDQAFHSFGGEEEVIAYVHHLYDTYVAPFDFKFIPDALEPLVIDGPAKAILASAVRAVHALVHVEA